MRDYNVRKNETTLPNLKLLTKNDILFVTWPVLMRGIDYRAVRQALLADGLSIFIMRDFPSHRSLIQGLGRVGRCNEPCKRFCWKTLGFENLVDKAQS